MAEAKAKPQYLEKHFNQQICNRLGHKTFMETLLAENDLDKKLSLKSLWPQGFHKFFQIGFENIR